MALVGVELETLISEPDALTTRPPPSAFADTSAKNFSCSCPSKASLILVVQRILRRNFKNRKKSELNSHMLLQKCNCEKLICYEQNFLTAYL